MSVIKKYKVIIQEDECAPDAHKEFNRGFEEKFGRTLKSVVECIVPIDLGDTFVYLWGDFRISNEIGFWKVEELEQ